MGYAVGRSTERFRGKVIRVRSDEVTMPGGTVGVRDVVEHPGAVGVVALDTADRVTLLHQYRHPVGAPLWELPAGLLDVDGERAHATAARELVEEAGLEAARWEVLVDALTSPGMTDEAVRIYLARDLRQVTRPPAAVDDEESDLAIEAVPFVDALGRVFAGEIRNSLACLGLLALAAWRARPEQRLRPADAPWPDRPGR